MISLEINGLNYQHFTQISVTRSYDKIPSDFSFRATTDPMDVTQFPIHEGNIVRVLVDGDVFVTGFVDEITVRHSQTEHTITVSGSSVSVDLIQSTMDSTFDIIGPVALQTALQNIVNKIHLNISVIDKTGIELESITEAERLTGNLGASVWSLMIQAALKRNVLLSEDKNGNILMVRGEGRKLDYMFEKSVNGQNNNLLSSSLTRTSQNKFHLYQVFSQPNATALSGVPWEENEEIAFTDPQGISTDHSIRRSRINAIVAEQSSTAEQCSERAIWQNNVCSSQSFRYQCTHQGYNTSTGLLIEPGDILFVKDDYVSLAAELMVETVTLNYSLNDGSIGTYNMVLPDAFSLQANVPTFAESGNDLDGIFNVDEAEEFS